jgi:hypothetical protein
MKRLRSKLTYANVIATLALFLVVAGGSALAASHLAKNSVGTKQIKNNAITTAKIKNGAITGSKVNLASLGTVPSATSATSATNATNATHATNADSATKATTAANAQALGGISANQYLTADSTLQSGKTEVGVWSVAAVSGGYGAAALNFDPNLPGPVEASHQIYLPELGTNPHCPGFGAAEAGYLCVYASFENNMTFKQFLSGFSGSSSTPAEPDGTVAYFTSTNAAGNARGNWAYTAP